MVLFQSLCSFFFGYFCMACLDDTHVRYGSVWTLKFLHGYLTWFCHHDSLNIWNCSTGYLVFTDFVLLFSLILKVSPLYKEKHNRERKSSHKTHICIVQSMFIMCFWFTFPTSKSLQFFLIQVCKTCFVSLASHMWTISSKHCCNIHQCGYDGGRPGKCTRCPQISTQGFEV